MVARILKQAEWATWIDHELRGYPDDAKLPSYRVIRCELKARNPFRGLIPIIIDHPEIAEVVSTCSIGLPISGLEDVAIPGKNVSMVLPPEMMAMLMQDLNLDMEPVPGGWRQSAPRTCRYGPGPTADLGARSSRGRDRGDEMPPSPQPQPLAPVTIRIEGGFNGGQLMVSSPGASNSKPSLASRRLRTRPGWHRRALMRQVSRQTATRDTAS